MNYLLDTNTCIYLIKKQPPQVIAQLKKLSINQVCISSVTLAELAYGVNKSQAQQKNQQALEEFILPLTVIPFDQDAAFYYGKIRASLERRGTPIGALDLMIAAHALSLGITLVTHNTREFIMQSQYQVLAHITQCLEQADIPYMLSGSVALSYYAQPRMTRDIDLVIEIQNNDVAKLAQQLGDIYYFDEEMAYTAIAQQSMFNILHQDSMIKIDCIVRKNHTYRQQEFSRRQRVTFNQISIWIVSVEDLLLSKLDWLKDTRSEMQFKDIANLIASTPKLDWTYLRYWAQQLDIGQLLEEIQP